MEQAGADQQRHQGKVALVNFDHVTLLKILIILTRLTMLTKLTMLTMLIMLTMKIFDI